MVDLLISKAIETLTNMADDLDAAIDTCTGRRDAISAEIFNLNHEDESLRDQISRGRRIVTRLGKLLR